jgi:hypothetical protein
MLMLRVVCLCLPSTTPGRRFVRRHSRRAFLQHNFLADGFPSLGWTRSSCTCLLVLIKIGKRRSKSGENERLEIRMSPFRFSRRPGKKMNVGKEFFLTLFFLFALQNRQKRVFVPNFPLLLSFVCERLRLDTEIHRSLLRCRRFFSEEVPSQAAVTSPPLASRRRCRRRRRFRRRQRRRHAP